MHSQRAQRALPFALGISLVLTSLSGCVYDEGLIINNMTGTVIVPRAAATRIVAANDGVADTECAASDQVDTDGDGINDSCSVVDVRNIGPVYVGLYPSVFPANVIAGYPHPEVGPIFQDGIQGDTYPYGGTTIGDFRFACFDALTCRVTSGRYESYDHIVDWFNDTLQSSVVDADGRIVQDGEYFRQTCFDLMEVTSDEEVMLLPPDRDDNGKIDAKDLDFVENADGDFEGEFKLWQQDFFWDHDEQEKSDCTPGLDCKSFSVWAFMDGPAIDGGFVTCDQSDTVGFEVEEYNHDFFGGRVFENVLNQPDGYVSRGDWVANQYIDKGGPVDGFYEWKNVYDQPTIVLGHEVTQ